MVYDPKTFQLCHELTEEGKAAYQGLLEKAADDILLRHQHPLRWLWLQVKGWLQCDA